MWMWLVLLYGIFKGFREIVKKKALEKNSTIEVLFMYTLIAFLMVLPDAKHALGMEPKYYIYVALKSFVIFLAWMFSFKAIKKMSDQPVWRAGFIQSALCHTAWRSGASGDAGDFSNDRTCLRVSGTSVVEI